MEREPDKYGGYVWRTRVEFIREFEFDQIDIGSQDMVGFVKHYQIPVGMMGAIYTRGHDHKPILKLDTPVLSLNENEARFKTALYRIIEEYPSCLDYVKCINEELYDVWLIATELGISSGFKHKRIGRSLSYFQARELGYIREQSEQDPDREKYFSCKEVRAETVPKEVIVTLDQAIAPRSNNVAINFNQLSNFPETQKENFIKESLALTFKEACVHCGSTNIKGTGKLNNYLNEIFSKGIDLNLAEIIRCNDCGKES